MSATLESGSEASTVHRVAGARIAGVVTASPGAVTANDAFTGRFGEAAVADVARMTGVLERHHVPAGQTAGDLCAAAGRALLSRLDWSPDSVDALIFVSQTPDHVMPATACVLQHELGFGTRTAAFDVNQGCSGYVYGLWLASSLVAAGLRRVLLLAGDTISHLVDPDDRSTALLFGDAGSATAVEAGEAASTFLLGSDGRGAKNLIVARGARTAGLTPEAAPDHLFMNGSEIFTFTLRAVPQLIGETLAAGGRGIEDVDLYLLHQANAFMLASIARKARIPKERVPINIARFGNTSSASIPLLLTTDAAARVTGAPSRLMLVGFGVGYSWASCLLDMQPLPCAEAIRL